eukprot:Pgem_evm1s4575
MVWKSVELERDKSQNTLRQVFQYFYLTPIFLLLYASTVITTRIFASKYTIALSPEEIVD